MDIEPEATSTIDPLLIELIDRVIVPALVSALGFAIALSLAGGSSAQVRSQFRC
jgi:hypothetical protein